MSTSYKVQAFAVWLASPCARCITTTGWRCCGPVRTRAGYRMYPGRGDLERLEQIVALKCLGVPSEADQDRARL